MVAEKQPLKGVENYFMDGLLYEDILKVKLQLKKIMTMEMRRIPNLNQLKIVTLSMK